VRVDVLALQRFYASPLGEAAQRMIARRLDAASAFGAELDSLSDFVCFGVAPGLLVFQFAMQDMRGTGWVFVLVYVICCCLRLARFNVHRNAPPPLGRPHFTGVPAPAGALLALLPVFLSLAGMLDLSDAGWFVAPWIAGVGLLMISRLRTISPKAIRVTREQAIWVLVGAAFVAGLIFTRFWLLMVLASLAYIATLIWSAAQALRPRPSDD